MNSPIVNALREQARHTAAYVVIDGHPISPEQTLYWKAADEIEKLQAQTLWDPSSKASLE